MENRIFIASDTKVFRDTVKLFDLIIEMTPSFPRDYKYTVGGQMQNLSMQLMLGIQHAFMMKETRQTTSKCSSATLRFSKSLCGRLAKNDG